MLDVQFLGLAGCTELQKKQIFKIFRAVKRHGKLISCTLQHSKDNFLFGSYDVELQYIAKPMGYVSLRIFISIRLNLQHGNPPVNKASDIFDA